MRIAARIAAIGATAAVGMLAPTAATASRFTQCGNENTFVVAVYVKGATCEHAFTVVSHWKAKRCEQHPSCTFTAYFHDVRRNLTYKCDQAKHVDHRNRDYWVIGCRTPDQSQDVRARDYPRGDYRPD